MKIVIGETEDGEWWGEVRVIIKGDDCYNCIETMYEPTRERVIASLKRSVKSRLDEAYQVMIAFQQFMEQEK